MPGGSTGGGLRAGPPGCRDCGAALAAAVLLVVFLAGCGGGDASGARVTVYVAAPLCAGAKTEVEVHGATAGKFHVAVRCLAPTQRSGGGVDLAAVGSNSRRATEDTSSVATLES